MNKKITIVEDELIITEGIKDILHDLGYEVESTHVRAESALEHFETSQPDLALLDISLKDTVRNCVSEFLGFSTVHFLN